MFKKEKKKRKNGFSDFFPFSCFAFGFCTGQNPKNAFGHNTKQRVKNTDFLNGVFKNEKNEKTNFQIFFHFHGLVLVFVQDKNEKTNLAIMACIPSFRQQFVL